MSPYYLKKKKKNMKLNNNIFTVIREIEQMFKNLLTFLI